MSEFSTACRRCPRLADYLDGVRARHPDYHALPVPSFGPRRAGLLIVGLAPGLHGANRTGRPFTGDHAGILLYETLYEFGFASASASSHARDGLRLLDCRITNAVRCVPPQNKPSITEVAQCNDYLRAEIEAVAPRVIVALGAVAHRAVVRAAGLRYADYPFAHGARHALNSLCLIDSYHCSRYNTQTRRLTPDMFRAVFAAARDQMHG